MSKTTLSGRTLKVRVSPKDYAAAIAVAASRGNKLNQFQNHNQITKYLVHSMIHLLSIVSTYVGYTQIYLF